MPSDTQLNGQDIQISDTTMTDIHQHHNNEDNSSVETKRSRRKQKRTKHQPIVQSPEKFFPNSAEATTPDGISPAHKKGRKDPEQLVEDSTWAAVEDDGSQSDSNDTPETRQQGPQSSLAIAVAVSEKASLNFHNHQAVRPHQKLRSRKGREPLPKDADDHLPTTSST